MVVCDPRKNALLKVGNKNDRVDARKLSELLRAGLLTPVYHGDSVLNNTSLYEGKQGSETNLGEYAHTHNESAN